MRKHNQGYTLVELLVGIAVGALVTLAATTVILMGLRLNRQSMNTVTRQNTARVLLTALEELAADGEISGVQADEDGWRVFGKGRNEEGDPVYNTIYAYEAQEKTVYAGDPATGTPIMKNVVSSQLENNNGLLTVSVETEEGVFTSSVYCRIAAAPSDDSALKEENIPAVDKLKLPTEVGTNEISELEEKARLKFVSILLNEYNSDPDNPNIGIIKADGENQGDFYSKWYIGEENWGENGWDEFTPWCACYISWAIAEIVDIEGNPFTNYTSDETNFRPSFAGVDSFLTYFYLKNEEKPDEDQRQYWITADGWLPEKEQGKAAVYPGDVIFLDWVVDEVRNPQHVGVVLYVEGEYVYTIEGNVAASYTDPSGGYGTVGLRKYKLDDPRILGYGVLDWKTGNGENNATNETP